LKLRIGARVMDQIKYWSYSPSDANNILTESHPVTAYPHSTSHQTRLSNPSSPFNQVSTADFQLSKLMSRSEVG